MMIGIAPLRRRLDRVGRGPSRERDPLERVEDAANLAPTACLAFVRHFGECFGWLCDEARVEGFSVRRGQDSEEWNESSR